MKHFLLAITAIFFGITLSSGQDLNKTWQFDAIENASGEALFKITDSDTLSLRNGEFNYHLNAKDNLNASGDYISQNNLLVFYYTTPTDTIRRYKITELTDSTLVFKENNIHYKFKTNSQETAAVANQETSTIIPSQGFSTNSLMRGILGMFVLLVIAILFSKNRKAINWRTVGFGLTAQLVLAIGVLKVPFVQAAFEWVGGLFIAILDFTMAGTKFLFDSFITGEIGDALITFAVTLAKTSTSTLGI